MMRKAFVVRSAMTLLGKRQPLVGDVVESCGNGVFVVDKVLGKTNVFDKDATMHVPEWQVYGIPVVESPRSTSARP